jgi:electron transfer flavoprotein beta subunit
MEILVCVKRVPDTAENEIEVNSDGSDIERDDLVYSVNEWDNYAVEEAIQIVTRWAAASRWSPWVMTNPKRCCDGKWPWAPTTASCFATMPSKGRTAKGIATLLKAAVEKATTT